MPAVGSDCCRWSEPSPAAGRGGAVMVVGSAVGTGPPSVGVGATETNRGRSSDLAARNPLARRGVEGKHEATMVEALVSGGRKQGGGRRESEKRRERREKKRSWPLPYGSTRGHRGQNIWCPPRLKPDPVWGREWIEMDTKLCSMSI